MERQPSQSELELIKKCKWREPNFPYVLFKKYYKEVLRKDDKGSSADDEDRGYSLYEDLCCLTVAGVHRQTHKLDKMMTNKNMKVVTWGNFPKNDDPRAKAVSGGGNNPWAELDLFLQRKAGMAAAVDEQISALEKKIADMTAAQALREGGKNGKV